MTHSRVSPVRHGRLSLPLGPLIYCKLHYTKEILLVSDKGVLMHSHCVANHIVIAGKVYWLPTLSPYVRKAYCKSPDHTGISKWISQTGHTRIIDVSLRAALVDFSCAIDVAGVSLCGWRSQFGYSC